MILACDYAVTDGRHLAEIDGDLLTICRASAGRYAIFDPASGYVCDWLESGSAAR